MARPRRSAPSITPDPAVVIPFDHPARRITRAIEEITVAARELHLPPIRMDWQEQAGPDVELDPETQSRQRDIETFLADYEGARLGPTTWPLPAIGEPMNPNEFLVQDLIRPGTTVMLSGPPGAAKSWASRQLGLTVAGGVESFLDRYAVPKLLNVLVVDEDNGPDEEWRREERLMAHLGLERGDMATYRRVSLEGVLLDQEPWQRWLRGQIRMHNLDLVILDPISELHGGKELREDPGFRSLLAFLKRLKVDFPHLAVILVHHTRKLTASDRSSKRGIEDVRGQWGQTPDVVIVIAPLGENRSRWETHKRVPHSTLVLEQQEDGSLKKVADETTAQSRRQTTDGRVLGAIQSGARTAEEVRLGTGLAKSGVYKALSRLAEAGYITKRAPYEVLRTADDPLDEEWDA